MSRVPAVVAPMLVMTLGLDHVVAILAPDVPSLSLAAATFQPGDYFDTGPPINRASRFERLLI
jgi:hypothetical protein